LLWRKALAQSPVEKALKVPGARPTLPISAGKQPFDNAFIAEAHNYWSNFHMQMGADHALYYTDHLSEFLPMALAPPVGEVSRIDRNPVTGVANTTFVPGDGSTSIPLDDYVMNGKQRVQQGEHQEKCV